MLISECFGPTLQGEGHFIGQKSIFIRTCGCDYKCSWCDTKYAWEAGQATEMTPVEVFNAVIKLSGLYNCSHVVITGGNPCIIGDEMRALIELLKEQHFHITIETQGSIWQDWLKLVDHVVLSPKPPSSRVKTNWAVLGKIRDRLYSEHHDQNTYSIKVVVFDDNDYQYSKDVFEFFEDHNYTGLYLQVGNIYANVPEPTNSKYVLPSTAYIKLLEKLEWLANKVVADKDMNEVRVLPQLHTLIWGNRRGV